MSTKPALAAALALALGCTTEPDEPTAVQFVALQRDFEGFLEWEQEWLGFAVAMPGHPEGQRTVYVNERPPAEAEEVPLGTVVVKATLSNSGLSVHAMAKRGGGYNDGGAEGWEWFELELDDEDRPVIVWRGEDAPNGECYGCLPGTMSMIEPTSCNDCHLAAADQDFVYTPLAR